MPPERQIETMILLVSLIVLFGGWYLIANKLYEWMALITLTGLFGAALFGVYWGMA